MRLVQIPLILAAIVIAGWLATRSGARTQAIRRIALVLIGIFAVVSIVVPDIWTTMASWVGIGRGTDLVLYVLVVAFFVFAIKVFQHFRTLEEQTTRLARRIALDEAPPPRRSTDPQLKGIQDS